MYYVIYIYVCIYSVLLVFYHTNTMMLPKNNEPSRILRFAQTVGQGVGGSSKHATADVGLMNLGGKKMMFQANLRKYVLSS